MSHLHRRQYKTRWKREKYQEEYGKLVADMGGCCAVCGGTERVEFDHVGGWREWSLVSGKIDSLSRVRRYRKEWEEFKAGTGKEVRLLCKSCNLKEMNHRKEARNELNVGDCDRGNLWGSTGAVDCEQS